LPTTAIETKVAKVVRWMNECLAVRVTQRLFCKEIKQYAFEGIRTFLFYLMRVDLSKATVLNNPCESPLNLTFALSSSTTKKDQTFFSKALISGVGERFAGVVCSSR
jgi:hypothetical protein